MQAVAAFFASIILAGSLSAPLFASALTQQEKNELVIQLVQKVLELQQKIVALGGTPIAIPPGLAALAQGGGSASGTAASCPITTTLARGARGAEVMCLQQFLIAQGLLAADSATGFFGPLTEAAVKRFQASQNIVSSGTPASTGYGLVGRLTRAAIVARITPSGAGAPGAPTNVPPSTGGGGGSSPPAPGGGGGSSTPPPPPAPSTTTTPLTASAQTWRVAELTLTTTKTYANPFTDVEVDAVFTGPGGKTITRPAFWDGGNVWKVRFAPTNPGTWTVHTSSSDPSNADFIRGGTVTATAYTGQLPIFKKGFLKGGQHHYLTYQDGTPFWYMHDELTAITQGYLDQTNKTNWTAPVPAHATTSQLYSIIERRVQQQYTVFSYWIGSGCKAAVTGNCHHRWESGKTGTVPDVENFQHFYDPLIKFTADHGLVVLMTLGYAHDIKTNGYNNNDTGCSESNPSACVGVKRMTRYIVARYGAYPMIWTYDEPDVWLYDDGSDCLPTAPGAYKGPCHEDTANIAYWGDVFSYTASLDGYRQPIGPWYWGAAVHPGHSGEGTLPIHYLDSNWISIIGPHCGHTSNTLPGNAAQDGTSQPFSMYQFYYEHYPNMPMIDFGGCNYEKIFPIATDDYIARRSAWRAIQSGSAGFGYGATGLWTMQWSPNTYDGFYANIPWYDAIDFAGGKQMQYITQFYRQVPWHTLVPHNGTASLAMWNMNPATEGASWSETEKLPLVSADPAKDWVIIYFPRRFNTSGAAGTITGLHPGGSYGLSWFDPRTGAYTGAGIIKPTSDAWTIPQKPGGNTQDWVLRMHYLP